MNHRVDVCHSLVEYALNAYMVFGCRLALGGFNVALLAELLLGPSQGFCCHLGICFPQVVNRPCLMRCVILLSAVFHSCYPAGDDTLASSRHLSGMQAAVWGLFPWRAFRCMWL